MVHITIEVVLFLALTFWTTSAQKRTNFHIKSLLQKVSEQEDRILRLESAARAKPQVKATAEIIHVPEPLPAPVPVSVLEEDNFEEDLAAELAALES